MDVTRQAKAVMLLTVAFGKGEAGAANPLTPTEWGGFARWLNDSGRSPEDLLESGVSSLLRDWEHEKVTVERLQALLARGAALAIALEKWQRAGLWVLTRSDPAYPARLKKHLRQTAPAVLFGCGNDKLLNASGIAIVGSRRANHADISFAGRIGRRAAETGRLVVSGGAAGVDRAAMLGALHAEGTAIGVLADSLLRSATSAKYREHLISGNLALISPFNPEARFRVGHAMARNRYIYCLARRAIIVASTPDRGGTWTGAVENLRHGWTPLWIKPTECPGSGNPRLVERGGSWLENLNDLFETVPADGDSGSIGPATDSDTTPGG